MVLDPMAGIGTTVIEAMHLGRHGVGVEYRAGGVAKAADTVGHGRCSLTVAEYLELNLSRTVTYSRTNLVRDQRYGDHSPAQHRHCRVRRGRLWHLVHGGHGLEDRQWMS
nr:hypothetical protein [Micromonospora sp. KC721]